MSLHHGMTTQLPGSDGLYTTQNRARDSMTTVDSEFEDVCKENSRGEKNGEQHDTGVAPQEDSSTLSSSLQKKRTTPTNNHQAHEHHQSPVARLLKPTPPSPSRLYEAKRSRKRQRSRTTNEATTEPRANVTLRKKSIFDNDVAAQHTYNSNSTTFSEGVDRSDINAVAGASGTLTNRSTFTASNGSAASSSSSSRSRLFQDDDPSLLAPATLLGTSDCGSGSSNQNHSSSSGSNKNDSKMATQASTPTSNKRNSHLGMRTESSSLFGAVMKNVQQDSSSDPTTPKTRAPNFAISPGGFQLLDFVNAVNSPFQLIMSSRKTKTRNTEDPSTADSPASTHTATSIADKADEWRETHFTLDDGMSLLDWTIKSRLQFEVQPAIAFSNDGKIRQQARQYFLSGERTLPLNIAPTDANSVLWHASLMYWRYPSSSDSSMLQHFLADTQTPLSSEQPLREANGGESLTSRSLSSKNDDTMDVTQSKLLLDARSSITGGMGRASKTAVLHQMGGTKRKPIQDERYTLFLQRKREWQQAFHSLYQTWIQQLRCLGDDLAGSDDAGEDVSVQSSVNNCYFYATGKGQVALFRASRKEDENGGSRIVPEIVVSSTSAQTRSALRHLGARLLLLDRWQGSKGEFKESVLDVGKPKVMGKDLHDASPTVKAELVALRRAQASGRTIGADVSVSMNKRGWSGQSQSPRLIPPLYMSGEDDCASFFEVYFNALGQMNAGRQDGDLPLELPVLLCRKLGPFQHASMETAQSDTLRPFRHDSTKGDDCSFDVMGILLPCAVRQLIGSACSLSEKRHKGPAATQECPQDDEPSAGSRHMIVRAELQTGTESKFVAGTIGTQSSKRMNGRTMDSEADEENWDFCKHGEALSIAVWDITRPGAIAYKVNSEY